MYSDFFNNPTLSECKKTTSQRANKRTAKHFLRYFLTILQETIKKPETRNRDKNGAIPKSHTSRKQKIRR